MPAGVTASNIRNNRRKQKEQQELASEAKAHLDLGSLQGSQEFLGGRRRVGKLYQIMKYLQVI